MAGTGADIFVDDVPQWNASGYSVEEDSTPADPSDTTGGFGRITVPIPDRPEIKRWGGKILRLEDGAEGTTTGTIRGRSGNGLTAQLVADSRIGRLSVPRRAEPFNGTLGDALEYYFGLCGITSGIVIEPGIAARSVVLPGWEANVFEQIQKKMGAAFGFEMSLVSNNVVVRPLRERIAVNYRDASVDWAMDEQNLAQTVEGYFYNTAWRTNALAYPAGGWSGDVQVYQVDAGATVELDLAIDASLVSVQQPTCVSSVDRNHTSSSVYAVSGNDGLIIPPAQWEADGGSLTVEIGEDTRSLRVTIKGGRSEEYAPYSIAMASGTSDTYSSLRIVGTGAFLEEELMTLPACQDEDLAPDAIGVTVQNEFFQTRDQLYHALLRTAARFSGARQTINVTSRGINRAGDSGSYVYPTIGDLKELYPGATIADLKVALGPKISDWNAALFETVRDDFANQSFGNVAGARVRYEDSWYRIRNTTKSPASVRYSAERDNTVGDVYRTGETIAEWNARWAGQAIRDVNIAPLQGLAG